MCFGSKRRVSSDSVPTNKPVVSEMNDDDEGEPAERMRGVLWAILGAALTTSWLAVQVLSTGAGCWFWAC